ncbi:hypothetical protein [Candidatus Halocynthiibacter alkanivorans]|nr:hypothetical protein [Candidatus Halocynthiibacter alkanivorans]
MTAFVPPDPLREEDFNFRLVVGFVGDFAPGFLIAMLLPALFLFSVNNC